MAATAPDSTATLLDLLRRSNILSTERLKALPDADALSPDPAKAASALVQKGFVTKFQATQLLAGRHKGFRIGQYVIQEQIGRGGMGSVYRAEHLELNRKVAIKVLAPGKGEDQKLALERFLREARSAAALDHPNIVKIFDVSRHNETPYLVMEFVDGDTLQQCVDRGGPMPFEVAAECIAQAAAGLQHAHEKSVVHRDIKPANLIRDRFGAVKILDMGLARSADERDKLTEQLDEGAVVGTADYIAPEQAINCPKVDARADIYSLGATLFTLVVGKTPFEGNTTQKLMQHQLRVAPPIRELNPDVPEEMAAIVAKMLAKKPGDRYQSAAEVIAALAPWSAASARVLAGLSQTSLGATGSHTALNQQTAASSRRLLSTVRRDSDSSFNPSESGRPTGVLSIEDTLRDPKPELTPAEPKPAKPRSRAPLFAGLTVALLAAGAVGAWLAFGRDKPTDNPTAAAVAPEPPKPNAKPANPNPAPKPNAKPPKVDPPTPVPPSPDEKTRLAADLRALKPFVVRSGLTADPGDATKKSYMLVSRTGDGDVPAGWTARVWNTASEMEVFADAGALGVRNARGPGAAMLFTPRFDTPSGVVRAKFEYVADGRDKCLAVKFKPDDSRGAFEVLKPAVGGTGWRTVDQLFDLKGASGGYFEFHFTETNPGAALRVRSVSVVEPNPISPDRPVFALDAVTLPNFTNAKTGRDKTGGDNDPKVPGVYFGGWKPDTQSEWTCGPIAGARAVGITNLSDVLSAQIGIELEGAVGLKFVPGQIVRVRVTYRTAAKGRGTAYLQNIDDRKTPARADLPNSNAEWKTVELVATRGANPLRLLVDTSEKGVGNTLFVRSVTVAEVGAARPLAAAAPAAPVADAASDPATWTEGATRYALDVAAIPAFRTQKEKGQRLGGDEERLPAGVGCQCWKEGAVGDFRRDAFDGAPALGVTNLNDEKSGQFTFSLEGAMKLKLEPGKGYRVKVGYRTANDATGTATVHVVPGYKGLTSVPLSGASGWKTATASFVRPPAEDQVELRMVIDNTSVGEGNTLWVRSVEVVELIPPKK